VVYLYRVQGDDPMPCSVSLRADGTAQVIRGGGHSGFRKLAVELDRADAQRSIRLAVTADHRPRSIRPLIHNLDAIIDGDTGHETSSSFHGAVTGTIDN
jgi:hypothetical protein